MICLQLIGLSFNLVQIPPIVGLFHDQVYHIDQPVYPSENNKSVPMVTIAPMDMIYQISDITTESLFKLSSRFIFHNENINRTHESPHEHEHKHEYDQENNPGSPKNGAVFIVIDFEHDSNNCKPTECDYTIGSSDDHEERR